MQGVVDETRSSFCGYRVCEPVLSFFPCSVLLLRLCYDSEMAMILWHTNEDTLMIVVQVATGWSTTFLSVQLRLGARIASPILVVPSFPTRVK